MVARQVLRYLFATFIALLYRPCLSLLCRMRSRPSRVRGPVDLPPCNRHRPFFMAGARQGIPRLVLAPHRGALAKSPGWLSFLRHPHHRFSWGCPSFLSFTLPLPPGGNRAHDGLAALIDVNVFDSHALLRPPAPELLQAPYLFHEDLHKLNCPGYIGIDPLGALLLVHRPT